MTAFYNKYNNTFCVVENLDLRVFNSTKGQSVSLVKNLTKDTAENLTIKCLRIDKRSRKGYLSTSNGALKVINIQNGVELCQIQTDMYLKKTESKTAQQQINEDSGDDENESQKSGGSQESDENPINDLQLVWNE